MCRPLVKVATARFCEPHSAAHLLRRCLPARAPPSACSCHHYRHLLWLPSVKAAAPSAASSTPEGHRSSIHRGPAPSVEVPPLATIHRGHRSSGMHQPLSTTGRPLSTIARSPAILRRLLRWSAALSPPSIEVTPPPPPPLILNFVVKQRLWYEISV
jgi:hypothetical protein